MDQYLLIILCLVVGSNSFRMYHIEYDEDYDGIFWNTNGGQTANEIESNSDEISTHDGMSNEVLEVNGTRFRRINVIFPGTKWCGSGNISEDNWSLGELEETDACCREHDFCDDILQPGQSKFNLTNNSLYTKLNCKCDSTFYDCLKNSSERESKYVGNIFFNVLGTECYMEEHPIIGCARRHRLLRRCLEYIVDTNLPEVWQWFDVPVY